MPYLPIRCGWTHFASSVETLALDYDPPDVGLLRSVRLEVRDFEDTLVYRSDPLDCEEGPAPVTWTGALNQGNDANAEPFATPLRSPYTLKILAVVEEEEPEPLLVQPQELSSAPLSTTGCSVPSHEDQAPLLIEPEPLEPLPLIEAELGPVEVRVAVLYHSLEIVRGPWEASTANPGRTSPAGLCHRLNQLGYYAGPPVRAGVSTDLLDKAKERFRQNHGDLRGTPVPTADAFADALDDAILRGTARPTLCTDADAELAESAVLPTGAGAPLRVYLEAVGFDEDLAGQTDEFLEQIPADRLHPNWGACANKTTSEAGKLNRPLVPLEAVIYLKRHDDARVAAPRAVGAVRVDWNAVEPGEDTTPLPFNDRLHDGTRSYIERLFRSDRVDLEHDGNSNCPALYGGIRTAAASNYRNPFWRGAQPYAPYAVPTDDGGARALWVPAYTDHGATPLRVGRAGVYFSPSLIAGDRYQIRAALSFSGRGNDAALRQVNADIHYETRPITVWRHVLIFAVVGWPARADYGNLPARCRARYAEAYTKVDFAATRYPTISQVINHQDYSDWFDHIRTNIKPSVAAVVGVLDTTHVHDAGPVVLANPHAVPDEVQCMNIQGFAHAMFDERITDANIPSAGGFLAARIADRIRTGHPCCGVVFLEYRLSDTIMDLIRDVGILGVPTVSNGNSSLMGVIDLAVDANPDFVFTHEVGHCFWLTHHENAGGAIPAHHDQYDHNCLMSYPYWGNGQPPYAHQTSAHYDPTFCGKCNLKLRGWDITHDHILALDAPTPPDALKLLFYYDRADPGLRYDREIATVRKAFTSVSRGPYRERFFDRNANFDTWAAELGDCDIYHHVTHGNVRCSRHGSRLASMDMATPRYPTWCRSDGTKVARLTNEEGVIAMEHAFDPARLEAWATSNFIYPATWFHSLRSVIQWTVVDDDSSQDIEFTYEQIEHALGHGTAPPRVLAFFSSCLLGWEKRFAQLFIGRGTANVIAFRSRYETAQALEFSEIFYRMWSIAGFAPDRVRNAFLSAALARPHAEPCLFTAGEILRTRPTTMLPDSGDVSTLGWNQDTEFYAPRFPAR